MLSNLSTTVALALSLIALRAPLSAEAPELLMSWELSELGLPADINLTAGQTVTVAKPPKSFGADGLAIRAELTSGNRNEFEWRSPDQRVFYKHREGDELWVGFRLLVPEPGRNTSACFFQVGPVRDGENRTQGTGHYQLILRGVAKTGWTWREFAGWPTIDEQPKGDRPRILNPAAPRQGFATQIAPFSARQTNAWVVQVRLHAASAYGGASEGLVRVWRDGERVFERKGANALPGDYTRVKWGPYIGQSDLVERIVAYYLDLRIARGGGDAGYLAVAPAEKVWLEPGGAARWKLNYPRGAVDARAKNLPQGWSLDARRREIGGPGDASLAGRRLLVEYLDKDGAPLRLQVLALAPAPRPAPAK